MDAIQGSNYQGWDALIQYYFHIDAETLDDDQYAKKIAQLDFCFRKTGQYKTS